MDTEVREKTVRKVPGASSAKKTVSLGSIDSSFAANPLAVRRSLNQGTAKSARKGAKAGRSPAHKPLPLEKPLPPKLLYKLQADLAALTGSSTSNVYGGSHEFSGSGADSSGLTVSPRSGRPLPAGWTAHLSGGQVYYYHAPSKHTQWETPGPDDDFSGVRSGHVKLPREAHASPGRWALEGGPGLSVLSDDKSDDGGSTDGSTSTTSSTASRGVENLSTHVRNELGDGVSDGSAASTASVRPQSSGAAPVLGTTSVARDTGCNDLSSGIESGSRPDSQPSSRPGSRPGSHSTSRRGEHQRGQSGHFTDNNGSGGLGSGGLANGSSLKSLPPLSPLGHSRVRDRRVLEGSTSTVDSASAATAPTATAAVGTVGGHSVKKHRGSGTTSSIISGKKKKASLVLPTLPSFYELEASRRKDAAAAARADALAHGRPPPALSVVEMAAAKSRHNGMEAALYAFEGTQPEPAPVLEKGPVGPSFYGSVERRNPRRLPSTAVAFWQAHAASAPVPTALGLSSRSFQLPERDEFTHDHPADNATSSVVSAAADARARSIMDSRAVLAGANPRVPLLFDEPEDRAAVATAAAAIDAENDDETCFTATTLSAQEPAVGEDDRRALRLVSLHGDVELWGDEGRSQLARPFVPAMIAGLMSEGQTCSSSSPSSSPNGAEKGTYGAREVSTPITASTTTILSDSGEQRDKALLAAASLSASAGAGPDWAEVMLAAPAFRFGLSPGEELAELDATRAALARRDNATTLTTFGDGTGSKRPREGRRGFDSPRGTVGQTGLGGAVDSAEPSPRDDDDDDVNKGALAFTTHALPSSTPSPPFFPPEQHQQTQDHEGAAVSDHLLDASELVRGARLFAWSADAHEAAWVVQRVWRKRQLRRGEAQTLIRRGFAGAAERAAYRDARADALRAATVLRHALGIYVRKRRSAQGVKWRAVVKLQAMARAKAAALRASKLAQNRAMQAALLIGTMLRARAKLRRKKQKRDELILKTTVYLQAWVRARRWRKELQLMKLAQKWFAHVWRQFFDRKYLRPLVALQRWARAATYGKHARVVQTYVLRPWLARQRASRQRAEVDRIEAIRRTEEDVHVGQAILVAVGAICDAHAGKGAFQGVMDKRSGKRARRDLDRLLRLREKELKIRHRAAIEAQQLPLGKEGSKNTNNAAAMATPAAKLRKEVRALLVLGCADGREAEGPNGKAVKAKLKEAKKAADVARKAKDKKRKEKVKAAKAKKKADRKAKAAAYKAAVAKAKKANKPLPEPEDHDSDSDDDGLAKEPTELQPNDEKFRWATPFTLEGPPPLPPLTEEDVDNATEQFLEDRLRKEMVVYDKKLKAFENHYAKDPALRDSLAAAALASKKKKKKNLEGGDEVDKYAHPGPLPPLPKLTSEEKANTKRQKADLKKAWKAYEKAHASFRDAALGNMKGAAKVKECGAVDIHALRFVVGSLGCTEVTDVELLEVMHSYFPVYQYTDKEKQDETKLLATRANMQVKRDKEHAMAEEVLVGFLEDTVEWCVIDYSVNTLGDEADKAWVEARKEERDTSEACMKWMVETIEKCTQDEIDAARIQLKREVAKTLVDLCTTIVESLAPDEARAEEVAWVEAQEKGAIAMQTVMRGKAARTKKAALVEAREKQRLADKMRQELLGEVENDAKATDEIGDTAAASENAREGEERGNAEVENESIEVTPDTEGNTQSNDNVVEGIGATDGSASDPVKEDGAGENIATVAVPAAEEGNPSAGEADAKDTDGADEPVASLDGDGDDAAAAVVASSDGAGALEDFAVEEDEEGVAAVAETSLDNADESMSEVNKNDVDVPYQGKSRPFVNERGYVALDERLILAIEQLVTRHRSGHPHQDHNHNNHTTSGHSSSRAAHATSGVGTSVAVATPAKESFHLMPKAATDALSKATATPFALRAQLGDQLGKLGHQLWTNLTQNVYHDAARYEHLRITRDAAFVKATLAFRNRRPARWSCDVCLNAFPLYADLRAHEKLKCCCRRAPSLGPDSTPQAVDAWNLVVKGLKPPKPKFKGYGHHHKHDDDDDNDEHAHQGGKEGGHHGSKDKDKKDADATASDAGKEDGDEDGSGSGSGSSSEGSESDDDDDGDDKEGGGFGALAAIGGKSKTSWFGGMAAAATGKKGGKKGDKKKQERALHFWDPSGGLALHPKALGGADRPYFSGLHPPPSPDTEDFF